MSNWSRCPCGGDMYPWRDVATVDFPWLRCTRCGNKISASTASAPKPQTAGNAAREQAGASEEASRAISNLERLAAFAAKSDSFREAPDWVTCIKAWMIRNGMPYDTDRLAALAKPQPAPTGADTGKEEG